MRISPLPRRSGLFLLLSLLSGVSAAASPPPVPEGSLYQIETTWRDDAGRDIRLADLRGKARVLVMFFSHCDNICPMLTGQLKAMERELSPGLRARTGFVLVTLDPENDDAAALADYRRRMGFDPGAWTLLRGSDDDTRELANLLGVNYRPKKDDGQIDHDGLIVVLDTEGRIVSKTRGIRDRKAFVKSLEQAARRK
jgi:protein SCO1/2